MKESCVDFVVNGEGEEVIVELANQLVRNKKFSKILGLGYKEKGKIFSPERRFIKDLSSVRADFSLVDVKSYFSDFPEGQKRVLTYITSRGCPHRCGFCHNLNYSKKMWRPYSMKVIKEDLDFLKRKYKINGIRFLDDNFFVDKERAFEILRHLDLPSHFDIRIDYVNEDILKKLIKLKVVNVLVGFESGSQKTQELLNKDYTVQKGIEFIKLLAKYHFRCSYSFIIALPTETIEDIKKTVNMLVFIIENHKEATFTVGQYLPYPGTPMYDKAIELGFKPPKTAEEWSKADRWDTRLKITWAKVTPDFCYKVRMYSFFIGARVPLITKICKFRLKTLNFRFPLDLKLFLGLYHLAYHSNYKLGGLIKNFANLFQFRLKRTFK